MQDAEKKFYVLRAISGKENKVREYLEAEKKNSDLGLYVGRIVIPTEKVVSQRNGKKVIKERSYMPGYILIEAALVGDVAYILRNTPDVLGFLGDGEPASLRPHEVERILGKADQMADAEGEYEDIFLVGDTVKVIDGAFDGFEATVEEVNTEKKKLKVMVKIFGRKTPLELGYAQVAKEE